MIETAKLNDIDLQRYLHYVLKRIADYQINRIEDLLPWNLRDQLLTIGEIPPICRAALAAVETKRFVLP